MDQQNFLPRFTGVNETHGTEISPQRQIGAYLCVPLRTMKSATTIRSLGNAGCIVFSAWFRFSTKRAVNLRRFEEQIDLGNKFKRGTLTP